MVEHEVLPATVGKKPKFFYGYVVVGASFLILAVVMGVIFNFGIFLKPLLTEFGWTRAETSGAYSLLFTIYGLLSIFAGRLNDRFGPRIILTVSSFLLGLGYLLISHISALWQLYLVYGVIIGVGISGCFVPLTSTAAKWFVRRRGLMTGIVVSSIGVGAMIMPPLATQLISAYGWRTAYMIFGIIVLVVTLVAAQFLRRDPSQVGQLPDGESELRQGTLVFQSKGFPLREAIRTNQFRMLCVMFFCFGFSMHAILVHIVIYATGLWITLADAATILVVMGGLNIVGRMVIGIGSDRVGSKQGLILVFATLVAAMLWLQFARELWALNLFAVVFGFANGGVIVLMSSVGAELFGLRAHGAILGIYTFLFSVGGAIGSVLAGRIFDITGSYQLAFRVFVALSIVGLTLSILVKPTSRRGGANDTGRSAKLYQG